MTLNSRKLFESGFAVVAVGDRSTAPTGEEYTEILVGKDPMFRTEEGAIKALFAALDAYAAQRAGMLYWRTVPEVDKFVYYLRVSDVFPEDELWIWKAYARLLISDKTVLSSAAA